jgi:hypothetical protein
MGAMSCDQHMVAWTESAFTFALNSHTRRTSEDQDPLVIALPMRLVRRRKLTIRDDALDTHIFPQQHLGENLGVRACGQVINKIEQDPISPI